MAVFIISKNGERLMPTVRVGHIRHLLKDGKAKIVKHEPFTVQLLYDSKTFVQDMEICVDSGSEHVGVSVKSATREYVSAQYDLLDNEKQRHDDRRTYRRTRRNRKRYRKPRFDNRKKPDGWFAPSVEHKKNAQIRLIESFTAVAPITSVTVEIGQFDPALMKVIAKGEPIPESVDYQHGDGYLLATLREAVFYRDGYKCRFCGRGIKESAILHAHHALYWKNRHGDTLDELVTACEKCHTTANHQKGGKLWGYTPDHTNLEGAAYMNIVRWAIINELKARYSGTVHFTYGAATKLSRQELQIEKSHVNDAYAMGTFRPVNKAETEYFTKRRRNNRCLEKFFDAQVIDTRDGKKKPGKALGCERIKRKESRTSDKSLRKYRGPKISKGRRSIRKQHYAIQLGDTLLFEGTKHISKGCHCTGTRVMLDNDKSVAVSKITIFKHVTGWQKQPALKKKRR